MSVHFSSELYSIEEILKNEKDSLDRGKNFYIPMYQRRYVWTKEHVLKLLDDIKEILEKQPQSRFKDYFIGGVVLSRTSIEGDVRSKGSLEVIDGQQRLTTISLIIGVLYKHLVCRKNEILEILENNESILEEYKRRLRDLIVRERTVRDNEGRRLQERKFVIERSDSLNVLFKKILEYLIQITDENCDTNLEEIFGEDIDEYQANLLNIANEIDNYISNMDDRELLDYCDQLLEYTKLVVTKTQDIDTGFLVFEKLNDSGVALKPEDLLKNFLFYSANEEEYQSLTNKWEDLLKTIDSINTSKTKMLPREFLEDYLISKGISVENSGNNPLFNTFKKLRKENFESSKELLSNLYDVAQKYKQLKRDEMIKKYLNLLNFNLGYKVLLSFLNAIGERIFEENKKKYLYRVLRISFVYMLGDKTKKLSELIPELCKFIIEKNGNLQDIDNWISIKISSIKDDFLRNIELAPIYKKKRLAKLALSISNYHLEGTKIDGSNITVEHILPQKPKWHECEYEEINEENYKNYVHRIGNLTLVDSSFNRESGNKCFEDKLEALLLNQNIYITRIIKEEISEGSHDYQTYRDKFQDKFTPLSAEEKWGKEKIEKRSKAFSKLLEFILIENNGQNFKLSYFD
ncbi:DUF262 domain-containing protein [Persephonella sp.]